MEKNTPSPAYSVRIRLRMINRPGTLGRVAVAIGEVGGNITGLEGFVAKTPHLEDDLIVYCGSEDHQKEVRAAVSSLDGVEILEWEDRTHHLHLGGKIEISGTSPLIDLDDLSMAYTPGVAQSMHGDRPRRGTCRMSTQSARTPWRSCPTAPPCLAWVTSVRTRPCR